MPNPALQPTAYSLRSSVASASGSSWRAALPPERWPPRTAIPDNHRRGAATVELPDQAAGHRRQSKSLKLEPISYMPSESGNARKEGHPGLARHDPRGYVRSVLAGSASDLAGRSCLGARRLRAPAKTEPRSRSALFGRIGTVSIKVDTRREMTIRSPRLQALLAQSRENIQAGQGLSSRGFCKAWPAAIGEG